MPSAGVQEPIDAYDLAVICGGASRLEETAMASLVYREILAEKDGRLQAGPKPLPPDAPAIEQYVYERSFGHDVRHTAEAKARRGYQTRLQRLGERGLIVGVPVAQLIRLVVVGTQTLALGVGLLWLLWSREGWSWSPFGMGAVVASLGLGAWGLRRRSNLEQRTLRTRRTLRSLRRGCPVPRSLHGWPRPETPVHDVALACAYFGLDALLVAGGVSRLTFLRGESAAAAPEGAVTHALDLEPIAHAFPVTFPEQRRAIDAAVPWAVVVVTGCMVWLATLVSNASGPPSPRFQSRRPELPIEPEIRVASGYGGSRAITAMPPVQRRPGQAPCASDTPEAELSVFAIVAKHEREQREREGPPPPVTGPMDHEIAGQDGTIIAATKERLYQISVDDTGKVHTELVGPLKVRVPTFDPDAIVERTVFQPRVDSLAFDRTALLWAVGDERLYLCSVANAMCTPRGIVPPDAAELAFVGTGEEHRMLMRTSENQLLAVQRTAAPEFLGEVGPAVMATLELCSEPGPTFSFDGDFVAGSSRGSVDALAVVSRKGGTLVLTLLPTSQAADNEPAPMRVDWPDDPVAITVLPQFSLLWFGSGLVLHLSPDGQVIRRSETGRAWRAAAAYSRTFAGFGD